MEKMIQGIYNVSNDDPAALDEGTYLFTRPNNDHVVSIEVLATTFGATESWRFCLTSEKPECQLSLCCDDRIYVDNTVECTKL